MNKKVIIVEDEFIVAEDLRLIVEKAGNSVAGIAVSVGEAVALINLHKPGLVLLDINLEGKLTGIDLGRQLKEDDIPFIYVSASSDQKTLKAANATQPYGFLVKPFRERDVVVALDIARYRHDNSLESALRREQGLIRSLSTINDGSGSPESKLLKIAMALQSHVPFDYLVFAKKSNGDIPYEGVSFLRLGMEEYQVIGITELLTVAGIKMDELKKLQELSPIEKETRLYNGAEFSKARRSNPMKNLLAETFELQSNLSVPIVDLHNDTCAFSFFSRKVDAYNADHVALLGRLYNVFTEASDYISLSLKEQPAEQTHVYNFEGIVGNDPALITVLDQLVQVAPFDTSVLILGETGTGKERIATCIHQLSPRSHKPMVKINCAVLPPTLIESELFGHEKGSFTGASDKRTGKFEQADGGTIFLDEIGEMPLDMQAKLLRVLQEKEIERVGGKAPIKVDVRIIAATNRVLEKEVAEGRFRMDLFYRLNVFPLMLPPLRERPTDIKQLAIYFAEAFCKKFKKSFHGVTPQMIESLTEYSWPGNIRELENVIEQSVVLNDSKSGLNLSRPLSSSSSTSATQSGKRPQSLGDIKKIQSDTERAYIISVLKKAGGRIRGDAGAAQLLNLHPTTLESRMAKLAIKKDEYA